MFNNDSNLKNINIISKFIGLFLSLSTIIICRSTIIFIIFSILFIFLNKNKAMPIILLTLSVIDFKYNLNLIIKILFIINYLIMFINIISFKELKYFLEELLYKNNSKLLNKLLSFLYLIKNIKINIYKYKKLTKSYGLKLSFEDIKFFIKKIYNKSKLETNKIMDIYRYNFYNISKNKTYNDKDPIDSYDFKYIIVYMIIFTIVFIFRGL